MALELTRKGGNNKNPKPQVNILPKIEEFFQKNPIMKIVIPVIGFVILVCIIPVYKGSHPKKVKENKPINWGIVLTWTVGVVGALIMGFGMSKIMVDTPEKMDLIIGMITGIVGLLICVLNYPIYSF